MRDHHLPFARTTNGIGATNDAKITKTIGTDPVSFCDIRPAGELKASMVDQLAPPLVVRRVTQPYLSATRGHLEQIQAWENHRQRSPTRAFVKT